MHKTVNPKVRPLDDDEWQQAEAEDADFEPWTPEAARKFREANPPASPWPVLAGQLLAGLLVAGAAWWLTGERSAGGSALYGALAVVVPAAIFARGLSRQRAAANAGAALLGFFVWELVKVVLTAAMLFAAPRLVLQLNWLALLAGFVVTMKVYWLASGLQLVRQRRSKKN